MPCTICEILENPSDTELQMRILEGKHWFATLRQADQEYLGTTFVTAKRHVGSLPELTIDEDMEFLDIRNNLITAQMRAFGAKVVNISCLMNEAFRDEEPEPHVHYHFKPRYESPVKFNDEIFEDRQFGSYIREKRPHPVSLAMGKYIVENIQRHLSP